MGDVENPAPPTRSPDSAKQVVKNSALLSALNVVVYASALLTDIMTARFFGLGRETDAFFIAFTIPQLIATILLISVDVSLVPLFSSTLIEEGRARLWRFSSLSIQDWISPALLKVFLIERRVAAGALYTVNVFPLWGVAIREMPDFEVKMRSPCLSTFTHLPQRGLSSNNCIS